MLRQILAAAIMLLPLGAAAQDAANIIESGRQAFLEYDFERAAEQFAAARKKARKNIPPELEEYEEKLMQAENFLQRVEKLVILDSIAVPKEDFFRHYLLPFSAGTLGGTDALPFTEAEGTDYVFTNEGDDFKMWAQPDSAGIYTIRESIRLTDGEWHEPTVTPDILNNGGNAVFPFMMSDGVTLYFASDNEESLGGFDIFVATRDAASGEYLQPQNIGMPYNSPYDDYLLAIDELNGVGWWATDRNRLGDLLTIYLFKVNDIRTNYIPGETEDLPMKARISDFRATWEENDFSSLLDEVREIVPGPAEKHSDFRFPMPGGMIYTVYDDFKTAAGRAAMKKYISASEEFSIKCKRLSELRRAYSRGAGASLKSEIRSLEQEAEKDRRSLGRLKSDVYRAERGRSGK